jgi:transcriptional regulator with XRE-family HTH domain
MPTDARQVEDSVRSGNAAIGGRLRSARLARRKTLAEVAEASSLTKSFVSKLERDHVTPSVASLIRLCDALGISVSSLFEAAEGEIVRRDEYPQINFGGHGLTEYLLTPRSEQRLQCVLSLIEPGGGSGPELYALPAEIEFVYVLGGQLTIQLDGQELGLETGDALTFSASTPHAFINPSQKESATILWLFAPGLSADGRITVD